MTIEEIFLFDGIEEADKKRMISCFNIRRQKFDVGETVCDFDKNGDIIGIIMSGNISLARNDIAGNRVVLENLSENDVFGEMIAFSDENDRGVYAVCEKKCEIAFMMYEHISKRCQNACHCHTIAVENMFRVVTKKAQRLSERIEILSNRSIREKLLSLFMIYSQREGRDVFELPFSLSYLAEYICADRSAMMREIRKMSDEGLIRTDRRKIELLH
ncbi:MAG: Crp/Fnr family transcriptional regulator [Oscillospiraceae bacterium]|nr:Crp/Fnr family transcriptional regulator [Oscillospiraceae bacterium]